MTSTSLHQLGLPPISHLGHVVRDLSAAIALYEPLYGPFTTLDVSVLAATYRGRMADVQLAVAFGRSGNLEIELIEWRSGESPHREFLEDGREGIHHVQFRVDDCDDWIGKLKPHGYEMIWYKRLGADTAFTYLERTGDPTLVELLQRPSGGSTQLGVHRS